MLKLYAIYGRHLSKDHMQRYCPTANPMAVATLKDYQLVFQSREDGPGAVANVVPAEGQEVPVVIWEISEQDERFLDIDQGIGPGLRTKERVCIEVNGKTLQALMYVMDPGPYGVPSDRYLRPMVEGYREFDLPVKALNDALIRAYKATVINGDSLYAHENSVLRPAQ